jgi:RNA polymerase I-specific transcription initiation factor RRN7
MMLEIDFSYPITQKSREFDVSYPEIQLMSLIVVATKLGHPFDDIVRHPESDSDPTTVKIDWRKWQEIMIDKPQEGLKRGDEIHVEDTDVASMSEKQMDDYLNWYQRTWIDGAEPKSELLYHLTKIIQC